MRAKSNLYNSGETVTILFCSSRQHSIRIHFMTRQILIIRNKFEIRYRLRGTFKNQIHNVSRISSDD